jgi:hypothetical protein
MVLKSLLARIGIDTTEFEAGMKRAVTILQAHQKTFTAIGGTMTAIGGIMTAFFAKSISEAAGSETAQAKLSAALLNVKGAAKDGAEKLIKYSEALQQTTGIEDDEIVRAQALLATFGLNEKQIAALTPRVLDMAVAHSRASGEQVNLTDTAMSLGRALTGHMELLGRQGVVLSEQTKKTGDLTLMNKDLDKAFGGAAAAAGQTFAGQLNILKLGVNDTMKAIGKELLPVVLSLVIKAKEIAGHIGEWIEKHKSLVKTLVPIIAGVGALNTLLGPFVMFLPKVVMGIKAVAESFVFLATTPVGILLVALGLTAAAFLKVKAAIDANDDAVSKHIKQNIDLSNVLYELVKAGKMTVDRYYELYDRFNQNSEAMAKWIRAGNEGKACQDELAAAEKRYTEELAKQKKAQEDAGNILKQLQGGLQGLRNEYNKTTKTIGETPLIGNWGKARQDLIDIFQAWNDSAAVTFSFIGRTSKSTVLKLVDDIQYMKAILKKLADESRAKFQETFAKIADVVSNITGRIGDIFSQSFTNRSIEIDNEFQKRSTVLDQTYLKEKATVEATAANKRKVIEDEAATKAAQVEKDVTDEEKKAEMLKAIQTQKQEALNALDAETKATLEKQEQDHADAKAKIEETLDKEKKKIARDQAKASKATNLVQAIVGTARAVVEALPNIPLSIVIGALGAIQIGKIASQPLPALGKGGFFDRPTAAIVGDVPEWVIPAGQMKAAFAGAGGSINFKQYVYFSGDIRTAWDIDEISEKLAQKTKEAIKRGRRG